MGKKGVVKTWAELTEKQKADVRKRMKPPYALYHFKIYDGKVAYRFINKSASIPKYRGGKG